MAENVFHGKNILLTGVGGFIGSTLAKKLLAMNANLICIDNFSYVERKWIKDIEKDIELIIGDVSERGTFTQIKVEIDYIFHFGAPSSIILFKKNLEKCYKETVLGQLNIFEFAKANNVEKVVYPSSGSIYGGNKKPHKETIYPKPLNIYGAAKMACEAIASCYRPFVKSTGLRIFAGYGPGEERKHEFASVIYLFIKDMLEGKRPLIFGDGRQTRDFIYIEDVADCVLRAVKSDVPIINVGTGRPVSFLEVIEIINNVLDEDIKPQFVKKDKNYVEDLAADIEIMERELKIKPIPIEAGIKKFIEYLNKKEV